MTVTIEPPAHSPDRASLMRIDLNLLTVFNALLAERSVSRAAAKLHVTQPAISNALARLRDLIGDPLLIKTRKGMEPTERALELIDPVREALDKIRMAVENARPFDPLTSSAEVSIVADEFAAQLFLPAIAQALISAAPGLTLQVLRASQSQDKRRASSTHFILADAGRSDDAHHCVTLVREGWKLVARRNHPGIAGRLDAAQYAALPSVAPWYEGANAVSWIDAALQRRGLKRNVVARIATPSPIVTAQSDHVMVLPGSMAHAYARIHGVEVHDIPLDGPYYHAALLWHREYDAAPMHRWARECIVATCQALAGTVGGALPQAASDVPRARRHVSLGRSG